MPESAETETSPVVKASAVFSKAVILGIFGLLIFGAAAVYFYKNSAVKRTFKPVGAVLACQQIPAFVRGLNFGNQTALSTSDRFLQGLVLVEGERKYQHPSWKSAGSLAPLQRDAGGNVYAAPAPWIDTLENKPDEQNKVYKVDGQTQEMTQFIELSKRKNPTAENPLGVLGLTFDCDTNSLSAATVAGSTRKEINGEVYQIDVESGRIISSKEGIDAIGLGVFNSAKGKRLYYGAARDSEIRSIDLDDRGFESYSETLQTLLPNGINAVRIDRSLLTDAETHQNIIGRLNDNPLLVTYTGHGSQSVWATSGIFRSEDAAQLANGQLSFYLLMNCLNGYTQQPTGESLGEALFRSANGAIAVWTSSGITQPERQAAISSAFTRFAFSGNGRRARIGDVVKAAKRASDDSDVRRTWLLIGDPAIFVK